MENHNYYAYDTELGKIVIVSDGEAITHVKHESQIDSEHKMEETALTNRAAAQIDEYLSGKRREFDVPLKPHGTDFQQSVWKALQEIPYGETRSYKQVAEAIGNPDASRAVGMANNKNPIWVMIPCHRVIGADGSLTGYGGGMDMKQKLLDVEKKGSK